jgi:hypothetical protein
MQYERTPSIGGKFGGGAASGGKASAFSHTALPTTQELPNHNCQMLHIRVEIVEFDDTYQPYVSRGGR